jgi:hypothetical protein
MRARSGSGCMPAALRNSGPRRDGQTGSTHHAPARDAGRGARTFAAHGPRRAATSHAPGERESATAAEAGISCTRGTCGTLPRSAERTQSRGGLVGPRGGPEGSAWARARRCGARSWLGKERVLWLHARGASEQAGVRAAGSSMIRIGLLRARAEPPTQTRRARRCARAARTRPGPTRRRQRRGNPGHPRASLVPTQSPSDKARAILRLRAPQPSPPQHRGRGWRWRKRGG